MIVAVSFHSQFDKPRFSGRAEMSGKRSFDAANLQDQETGSVVTSDPSVVSMPLKRFFRSRAHCNPLSHNDGFHYPLSPEAAGDNLARHDIISSEYLMLFDIV